MITPRIIKLISHLRRNFAEQSYGAAFRHALFAYRDVDESPLFGDAKSGQAGIDAMLPIRGFPHLIAFGGMEIIRPVVWTPLGAQIGERTAKGIIKEAVSDLVQEPGVVADSIVIAAKGSPETTERYELFSQLAEEGSRLLDYLYRRLTGLGIDYHGSRTERRSDSRWLYFLHQLGWREDPESGVGVERWSIQKDTNGRTVFLPFHEEQLKRLIGVLPSLPNIEIPPTQYLSLLNQDPFRASVFALDDLEVLLDQPATSDLQPSGERSERTSVFVSYARKDEKWLNHLEEMLAPALRNKTMAIWYDQKTKPGELWRREIQFAMERAHVGVLLVTPAFMASEFIANEELPFLYEQSIRAGIQLLWIPVEPCMHELTLLDQIQATGDPKRALKKLTGAKRQEELKRVCKLILDAHARRSGQASGPN